MSLGGVSIGTLYAELKLSKDQFETATKSSGSLFSGLKTVALGAGVAIAGALVAVGVAAIDAAKQNEIANARLQTAIKASVKGWDGNTAAIDAANAAGVRKGFSDDDLTNAMSGLVTRTHDVGKATDLLATAEDLARLKGIDVGTAAGIVGKVYDGNVGVLGRYGIAVKDGASAEEALGAISKTAAGQADAYAKTSAGQWDTFNASLGVVLASIGEALLPILSIVANIATTVLIPAIQFLGDLLSAILSPIIDAFSGKTDKAGDKLGGVGDTINSILKPPLEFLTKDVLPKLTAAFDWITKNVLPPLMAAFDWIAKVIFPLVMKVIGILVNVYLSILKAEFDFITEVILPALAQAFDWIVKNVIPPLGKVFEIVAKVVGVAVGVIATVVGGAFDAVKRAIDIIWPIVNRVGEVLFAGLRAAGELLGKVLGGVWDGIKKGIDTAGNVIGKVVDTIKSTWEGLKGMFQTVGDSIGSIVRNSFNTIIGIVNGIIGAVNSIQVHIGRVGLDTPAGFVGVGPFDWGGLNIGKIGYLASGTDSWRGGLAMLGEQGPELAMLPRGTAVFNAGQTRDMVGRLGGGPIIGQQIINGLQPDEVERQTTRAIRRVALDWNLSGR